MKMSEHNVHDHFAGAGGWDVAARSLGAWAEGVEIMPEARETRDLNGLLTVGRDVWNMDSQPHTADTFVSSPPCQAYSLAGSGAGRKALDEVVAVLHSDLVLHPAALKAEAERWGDERVGLVLTPVTYALRYRPQYIALEQVPTVLPVWEAMAERLRASGYKTWTGLVYAEQYGVPQTRKRAVLMATLSGHQPERPTPTHSRYHARTPERLDEGVAKWVSMAEALGWDEEDLVGFPRRDDGQGSEPPIEIDGIAYRRRDLFEAAGPAQIVTSKGRSWKRFHPVWASRPATTIVASFRPDVIAGPGYRKAGDGPRQNAEGSVVVTIDEAAAIQSFPPGFRWAGTRTRQFVQCGNAIPPKLASAVLAEVWKETE